jgi:hypothetical protein
MRDRRRASVSLIRTPLARRVTSADAGARLPTPSHLEHQLWLPLAIGAANLVGTDCLGSRAGGRPPT